MDFSKKKITHSVLKQMGFKFWVCILQHLFIRRAEARLDLLY
jgi:hypothetical protein